jgi:hypothetical protein
MRHEEEEDGHMPMHASYIRNEDRLDVVFTGNVDISLSQDICDLCRQLRPDLRVCIIDLSDSERLFDSGVALLQLLNYFLVEMGTTVVILSDRPEIHDRISDITRRPLYPPPTRYRVEHLAPLLPAQGPLTPQSSRPRPADHQKQWAAPQLG